MGECVLGTMCFELTKSLPTALVALVIGIVGAFIATHQYRVARAKLKLDLFDKRFAIFKTTWGFMSEMAIKGPGDPMHEFTNIIPEAEFLFGPDIAEYLREASKRHTELWSINQKLNRGTANADEIDRNAKLTNWFFEQASTGLKQVFSPYLSFDKWR